MRRLKINNEAFQEEQKMRIMELFINNPIKDESNMEEQSDKLTQAKLDELAASFLDLTTPLITFDQQLDCKLIQILILMTT
jgi:hypothetical protein